MYFNSGRYFNSGCSIPCLHLTVLRFSFSFQFYRGGGAIPQSVSLAHVYIVHVQNEDFNDNKINTNQLHSFCIYGNMIPKKYKTIIIHRNIKMLPSSFLKVRKRQKI